MEIVAQVLVLLGLGVGAVVALLAYGGPKEDPAGNTTVAGPSANDGGKGPTDAKPLPGPAGDPISPHAASDPHSTPADWPRDAAPAETRLAIAPAPVRPDREKSADPPPAGTALPPDVKRRIGRATVDIRTFNGGTLISSGSGFFGSDVTDVVVTTADVLGMNQADSRTPGKVEVIVRDGKNESVVFYGDVLAADRITGLAVLKLRAVPGQKPADFPEPLTVDAKYRPRLGQPLFFTGHTPDHDGVAVGRSQVSGLTTTPDAQLEQVQVRDGMQPGHSGGPVVDVAGHLIGVAVGRTACFAIPMNQVREILDGRLVGLTVGEPIGRDAGAYAIKVELDVIDPLRRIKGMAVDWWWGAPADAVPAAWATAPAVPPGATRRTVSLTNAGAKYTAEIVFPAAVPPDKVMWFQPHFDPAAGADVFVEAVGHEVAVPPDRRSATLSYLPRAEKSKWTLVSSNRLTASGPGGERWSSRIVVTTQTEEDGSDPADGHSTRHVRVTQFTPEIQSDGKPPAGKTEELDVARRELPQAGMLLSVDALGNVQDVSLELDGVPNPARRVVASFATQIGHLMDFCTITFRNARVQPGQRWKGQRQLSISTLDEPVNAVIPVHYTFRGVRTVNGRELGVIDVHGRLQDAKNQAANLAGTIRGTVHVDLTLGRVESVRLAVDSTLNVKIEGQTRPARSRYVVTMSRS